MNRDAPLALAANPIHLGRAARATPQPPFPGGDAMAWYAGYEARAAEDGADGRLVSLHSFAEDWDSWEMHPSGDEVVVCTAGSLVLHQEQADGTTQALALGPGDYAINPPGVWHTTDTKDGATALFITAGIGTRHRPR